MLQFPQTQAPHRSSPRSASVTAKRAVSAVEKAIADHKRAVRISAGRERELKAIYAKFPDLEHHRPPVLFWKSVDGKEHHGRQLADYTRVFPRSFSRDQKAALGNALSRKQFKDAMDAAYPAHTLKRKAAGIVRAEGRSYSAHIDKLRAYNRLLKTTPQNAAELQNFAGYMILIIRKEVGGRFGTNLTSNDIEKMGGLEICDERLRLSQCLLSDILHALARKR